MWWNFCEQKGLNPYDAEDRAILEFLAERFNAGAAYGTLNTARSAISLISLRDLANSNVINRFFKGAFRLRPTAPRYNSTWDVNIVLSKLERAYPYSAVDLKCLTEKLVMLLALGTSFRVQSIALIRLDSCTFDTKGAEIRIQDVIKTSRPGACQPFACLPFFKDRPGICIAGILHYYIDYTRDIRGNVNNLILTYKKPYKAACSQTISRWLKNVLRDCGIDRRFTGHSTRHASTSKAFKGGLSISAIKNAAGWSSESQVFAKYYNKHVQTVEKNFAETVFF